MRIAERSVMERLSRRQILQLIGAGAVGIHCGTNGDDEEAADETSSELSSADAKMLHDVDNFVVVMMENRSFDHYMGALQRDPKYAKRKSVNGTTGDELNLSPAGHKVKIHDAGTFKLESPPHSFAACHAQWNGGKNDRFVIENAGPHQDQAMAFYDRRQIPFYYWLADNFTVCDRWHASVMGPTWPNRLYLHAGTSAGRTNNTPIKGADAPNTIWDQLRKAGVSAKNYHAGGSALITHALPDKAKAGHIPVGKIKEFFADAKAGSLPSVSFIDPDYGLSDDHPDRDIRLGQAFVKSIYKALRKGPQWTKTMLIVIYDEHGGFYDHVAPPVAEDARDELKRFGFRVPAFIAGGMVRRGHVDSTLYDHTSVAATLAKRFKLGDLSKRAAHAHVLTAALDPARFRSAEGLAAPADPEPTVLDSAALATAGATSQPEVEASEAAGDIPESMIDRRPLDERMIDWLDAARDVGAVTGA
jgi:phospholipase C